MEWYEVLELNFTSPNIFMSLFINVSHQDARERYDLPFTPPSQRQVTDPPIPVCHNLWVALVDYCLDKRLWWDMKFMIPLSEVHL